MKVIKHLGFPEKLVSLITSCMSIISYFVLLNGQPMGHIKPSMGLRQGNPLSPYLFLLCAMGLQGLIKNAENNGDIKGVCVWRNGPRVSHLFFVDYSVLICWATVDECQRVFDLLSVYEKGLGQKINREKTNIFFSANT